MLNLNTIITPCKTGVIISCFEKGRLIKTTTVTVDDLVRDEARILHIAQPEARQ